MPRSREYGTKKIGGKPRGKKGKKKRRKKLFVHQQKGGDGHGERELRASTRKKISRKFRD